MILLFYDCSKNTKNYFIFISKTTNMPEFITRYDLILNKVTNYYKSNPEIYKQCVDIIERKGKLTVTIIEYFILNYARKHSTLFMKENGTYFIVYVNYKNFLNDNGKEYADPFRRKKDTNEEFLMFNSNSIEVKTRLAQLNFLKWTFEHEIIAHIEANYDKIYKELRDDSNNKNNSTS